PAGTARARSACPADTGSPAGTPRWTGTAPTPPGEHHRQAGRGSDSRCRPAPAAAPRRPEPQVVVAVHVRPHAHGRRGWPDRVGRRGRGMAGSGNLAGASRGATVYDGDIETVVVSEQAIQAKITELAAAIDADYADRDILLVGVLKGAVMFM